jgi:hypothetical protein
MKRNTDKHLGKLGTYTPSRILAKGELPVKQGAANLDKELGEIAAYDVESATYRVLTRGVMGDSTRPGGKLLQGVPRKQETPNVVSVLPVGTTVVIENSLGFPYIDGVLNVNASRSETDNPLVSTSIAGDAEIIDNTAPEGQGYYRSRNIPKDLVGSDFLITSPDGNRMGVLRGRYNVMDGGPGTKAKIETFGEQDLTRITTEDFELLTGFGMLKIHNSEGRCGLSFRAASDQLNESGGEEELWTFRLDIGDDGDFFNLEVGTPEGGTAAKFNITPDGKVTHLGLNGVDLIGGDKAPSHQTYGSDLLIQVLGKIIKDVSGSVTESIQGNRTTTVSESDQRTAGHNEEVAVNNHQIASVGGNQYVTISGGSAIEAKPSNIAVEQHVLNGSYHLELGNPLRGANPAALAGLTLAVNNGDIVIGENAAPLATPAIKATASLNTRLPNSVALGGTANPFSSNPALFHAVKYEPLMTLIQAIFSMHDGHVHVPPVGGTPSLQMNAVLGMFLPQTMSNRVLMGA